MQLAEQMQQTPFSDGLPANIFTLTNKQTGREYGADAEGEADVNNPDTPTKKEDLRRDVLIKIKKMPDLLAKSGLSKT